MNPHGSERFPATLERLEKYPDSSTYHKRFKETYADRVSFKQKSQLPNTSTKNLQMDEPCTVFTEHIINAAKSSIPQVSGTPPGSGTRPKFKFFNEILILAKPFGTTKTLKLHGLVIPYMFLSHSAKETADMQI